MTRYFGLLMVFVPIMAWGQYSPEVTAKLKAARTHEEELAALPDQAAPSSDVNKIADVKARAAAQEAMSRAGAYAGYHAVVENAGLSLFAGLNPHMEEHMCTQKKMHIASSMEQQDGMGHSSKGHGVFIFDGEQTLNTQQADMTPDDRSWLEQNEFSEEPAKSAEERKKRLEARIAQVTAPHSTTTKIGPLEKKGAITRTQFMAGVGNLMLPFEQYRAETVKLERETPQVWVFTGKCNYAMMPWAQTRAYVDKATGLMVRLETDQNQFLQERGTTPLGQADAVPLLVVKSIEALPKIDEKMFDTSVTKPTAAEIAELKGLKGDEHDAAEEKLMRKHPHTEDITDASLTQLLQRVWSVQMREKGQGGGAPSMAEAMAQMQHPPGATGQRGTQKGASAEMELPKVGIGTPVPTPAAVPIGEKSAAAVAKISADELGIKFVKIPEGTFVMGSPAGEKEREEEMEKQHSVKISKPFDLAATEVTQSQWEKVMGNNPAAKVDVQRIVGEQAMMPMMGMQPGRSVKGPNIPVTNLSWNDSQEFCRRLTAADKAGAKYRLPTEVEWEYSCRAGSTTSFYWGGQFDPAAAWAAENSGGQPHEVGKLKPNAWGIYDMSGNVAEWCQDVIGPSEEDLKDATPEEREEAKREEASMQARIGRGGSFLDPGATMRSAMREYILPAETRAPYMGLRVVRE